MRSFLIRARVVAVLAATVAAAVGQSTSTAKSDGATGASVTADTSPRPAPRFDVSNIDKSLDPCVDFYQYACAKWMKNNPIPADYADWVSFSEVYEYNLGVLHSILEKASADSPQRTAIDQKIGDYYASCMDEKAINKAGYTPLKAELERIAALKSKTEMM